MMHHNTKFDCERLIGSGDVGWTKSGHMERWTQLTQYTLNTILLLCVCVFREGGGIQNSTPPCGFVPLTFTTFFFLMRVPLNYENTSQTIDTITTEKSNQSQEMTYCMHTQSTISCKMRHSATKPSLKMCDDMLNYSSI